MVELAILTQTAPKDWWDEPLEVIATAYDVLVERATRERREARGR